MKKQAAKQTAKKTETKALPAPGKPSTKPLAERVDVAALAAEDAGVGQEGMSAADYAIPRLAILQSGSPQVKKSEQDKYIKGAEEGMICDILNSKVFSGEKGITVIPISYRRSHIEWTPREKGGGFVKDHGPSGDILAQTKSDPNINKGKPTLPNGNTIATVAEYFVFLLADGAHVPYVLTMAGSQLKKARRWNTMFNQLQVPHPQGGTFNPAMFYRTYKLTTVPEKNDQGSWFGWNVAAGENVLDMKGGDALYMAARDFRKQITSGAVNAAPASGDHMRGAAPESDDAPM